MEAPGDGRFEIAVPPGAYDLFVTLPDIKGWGSGPPGVALTPVAFGRTSIEVLEDVNELTVTVHPGVDLKGRVTIDGQPASGANAFQIALQPDASAATIPAFQSIERFRPAIGADGSFLFPALPEANYDVQVLTAVASSIQLTDILLDGKSVLNTGIAIGSTQPGLLEIVLKTRDK
jgi:hypothetical protein